MMNPFDVQHASTPKPRARSKAHLIEPADELREFLEGVAQWSSFASDILTSARNRGGLTQKQHDAAIAMKIKIERKLEERAEREAKGAANEARRAANSADMKPLVKRIVGDKLRLFVSEVELRPAPTGGANGGCVYVKGGGQYAGKIRPDGHFAQIRSYDGPEVDDALILAAEALAAGDEGILHLAKAHARKTGECCFCGRELTKGVSIEAGYGPTCAEKWSLPWGEED